MTTLLDVPRPAETPTINPVRRPKRHARLLLCLGGLPLALFAGVYLMFFTPESPPRVALSVPQSGTDTSFAIPAGRWSVGRGSIAGYRVREKLLRLPASNDAVGRTDAIVGDFHLEPSSYGFLVKRGMRVEIDVSTLKSDEPRRDDHMRTMAIETDMFPTAAFVTTADLVVPHAVLGSGAVNITVTGDLTLHGVTRSVTIPIEAQRNGDRIEVVGSFNFSWDLFEIRQPNLSYVTVESDPTLELQLFFDHESAHAANGVGSHARNLGAGMGELAAGQPATANGGGE